MIVKVVGRTVNYFFDALDSLLKKMEKKSEPKKVLPVKTEEKKEEKEQEKVEDSSRDTIAKTLLTFVWIALVASVAMFIASPLVGYFIGVKTGLIVALLSGAIAAYLISGFDKIETDPPYKGIVRIFERNTNEMVESGWQLALPGVMKFEHFPVEDVQILINLKEVPCMLDEEDKVLAASVNVEAMVVMQITHPLNLIQKGGIEKVKKILEEQFSSKFRIMAAVKTHPQLVAAKETIEQEMIKKFGDDNEVDKEKRSLGVTICLVSLSHIGQGAGLQKILKEQLEKRAEPIEIETMKALVKGYREILPNLSDKEIADYIAASQGHAVRHQLDIAGGGNGDMTKAAAIMASNSLFGGSQDKKVTQ